MRHTHIGKMELGTDGAHPLRREVGRKGWVGGWVGYVGQRKPGCPRREAAAARPADAAHPAAEEHSVAAAAAVAALVVRGRGRGVLCPAARVQVAAVHCKKSVHRVPPAGLDGEHEEQPVEPRLEPGHRRRVVRVEVREEAAVQKRPERGHSAQVVRRH